MMEDQGNPKKNETLPSDIARRDFVALSVAAGLAGQPRRRALTSSKPTSRFRLLTELATPRSFTRKPAPIRAC